MSDSDEITPGSPENPTGATPEQTLPPAQPGQPVQPSGQVNAGVQPQYRPAQPGQPGQPGQPQYRPAQPGQPGQPGQPQYRPAQPGQPGQPQYRPAQPGQPGQRFAQAAQSPQSPSETQGPAGSISPDRYPFRLLADEQVLGSYPLARVSRPLGKLTSFIFVTDSRLIYAAECKSVTARSYQIREFDISKVHGVQVGSHSGLDALGAAITGGFIVNLLVLLVLLSLGIIPSVLWLLPFFSILFGVIAVLVLRSPSVVVSVLTEQSIVNFSASSDEVKRRVRVVLLVVSAVVLPLILLLWMGGREMGIFRAEDSASFAKSDYVDRLSRDLGAQIVDIQAMGKMATRR